ncbi:MAG: reverse transcriptase domain-containing protein [Patescibacteria group bacterium]
MKIQLAHKFESVINLDNLLSAWQEFQLHLMDNILELHNELVSFTYQHGGYQAFNISDPKPRNIHKATVRDRLLHHAIYTILYPFFDKTFIADSFSCRKNKGTHKAINCFRSLAYQVSQNNTKTCWILKCDIRKFFASIDHKILLKILAECIPDKNILWLLRNIIDSFHVKSDVGLPLGNLTSQLLVNIYMNEFDQFIKHQLKARYYIRYADDFVILSDDKNQLEKLILVIKEFLNDKLKLSLHKDKIFIKTLYSGVDFLGWVHFEDHRILRTTTKRRMVKRIRESPRPETINSYLGLLRHGNTQKIRQIVYSLEPSS